MIKPESEVIELMEKLKQLASKHKSIGCFLMLVDNCSKDVHVETNACPACIFEIIEEWREKTQVEHIHDFESETIN